MPHSYRPTYHASVPSGWGNDPNGVIFYGGRAHLFYQHYPHAPIWGTMHWGHFVTRDFVRWQSLPAALTPDEPYEAVYGCFSGSAVESDGRLYLLYTAAQPDQQRQCIAVSSDGVRFTKAPGNPIITAGAMSPELSPADFRDPCVFRHEGRWYMLAGTRILTGDAPSAMTPTLFAEGTHPGFGNLVLLRSDDLYHWSYVGRLLRPQPGLDPEYLRLDGVYECPDYFTLDGAQVLLACPQNLPRRGNAWQNLHSALYMLGALDFGDGHFRVDAIGEIDAGFDFYAPQTLRMPDGRVILLAWKEMWDRSYPTQPEGWAGTYALPRELRVRDGRLIQTPVREIEAYRQNPVCRDGFDVDGEEVRVEGVEGQAIEIEVTLEPGTAARAGMKLFAGREHETLLYYDRELGALVFDRSRSGQAITGREADVSRRLCDVGHPARLALRVFLDVSSVEVFVDGGRQVMSGNVYPDAEDAGAAFFAEGGRCRFTNLRKYDIVVEGGAR